MSEGPGGLICGFTLLAALAGLFALAGTGTVDDAAAWVLGPELLAQLVAWLAAAAVAVVVAAVAYACRGPGSARLSSHSHAASHADDDPDGDVAGAVIHEGRGHAAVGHGVGIRILRAEVDAHGGGTTWYHPGDWRRATPAQRMACSLAGERAAGPAGCRSDRRSYAAERRGVPRAERAAAEAEAARLCNLHVGSAFGQRVARALERRGRWH